MSYASFASPALPAMRLPIEAINRHCRLAIAIVGMVVQCLLVAAVLWAVVAAPGLLTERGGTGLASTVHR